MQGRYELIQQDQKEGTPGQKAVGIRRQGPGVGKAAVET